MIISVGSDILEIARVERLQKNGRVEKIFTEEERRQSGGKASRLAGDFSVKEAVAKALGTGVRDFSLLDIEVLRDKLGKPYVNLYGNALRLFQDCGGKNLDVSISNTKSLVIATAVILGETNVCRTDADREARALFLPIPKRNPFSHKGSYGTIGIFAGKKGMAGAASFAALAAYRAGAGLVHLYSDKENRIMLQTMVPEAILSDIDEVKIEGVLRKSDIILFGPGMGTEEETELLLLQLLKELEKQAPDFLILDADALNMLAASSVLEEALSLAAETCPIILTPHLKEFSRLCHCSMEEILANREELGRKYAAEHHCIIILKSHDTMVFTPFSEEIHSVNEVKQEGTIRESSRFFVSKGFFQNIEACPSLSKGGSGDVFSGLLAGLLAVLKESYQDLDRHELAFQAACLSVLIQVRGGKLAAEKEGEHAVLARDLPHYFALAMQEFIEKDERENDR